jgi:hypothetical protein
MKCVVTRIQVRSVSRDAPQSGIYWAALSACPSSVIWFVCLSLYQYVDIKPLQFTVGRHPSNIHNIIGCLCKIWSFHGGNYEECRLLGYKDPVRTSQETHYVTAAEPRRLMLCTIWGFHGGGYEQSHFRGYKNPVNTSQETHYVSAAQPSQLMLCKIWGLNGGDYDEFRLLGCHIAGDGIPHQPFCLLGSTYEIDRKVTSQRIFLITCNANQSLRWAYLLTVPYLCTEIATQHTETSATHLTSPAVIFQLGSTL